MQRYFIITLCLFLSACGLALEKEGQFIKDYRLRSAAVDNKNQAAISPSVNNGQFSIDWTLELENAYRVSLYLETKDLVQIKDKEILSVSCEQGQDHDICSLDNNFDCTIDRDLYLSCNLDDVDELNAATVFTDSPKTAYLLLEVCDLENNSCDTESRPVTYYEDRIDLEFAELELDTNPDDELVPALF